MLTSDIFTKLEAIARHVRRDRRPFGGECDYTLRHPNSKSLPGIQLILSGDFLQLPPVEKTRRKCVVQKNSLSKDKKKVNNDYGNGLCFESPLWKICISETVLLTKVAILLTSELQMTATCIFRSTVRIIRSWSTCWTRSALERSQSRWSPD